MVTYISKEILQIKIFLRHSLLIIFATHAGPSPYVGGYVNLDFPYRPSIQGSVARIDSYAMSHDQMGVWPGGDGKIAYGSGGVVAAAGAAFPPTGGPPVRTSGGFTVPTNADAAVHGSAGASASTSGR